MKRINPFTMYRFGSVLRFMDGLTAESQYGPMKRDCATAHVWFEDMQKQADLPIQDAKSDMETLDRFCLKVIHGHDSEKIGDELHEVVSTTFTAFENVLRAEWSRLNVYFVTRVAAYDTDILLSSGRTVLPDGTAVEMTTEALSDLDEGTRCLALKCATAAGFHLLRSVEAVMRSYYDVVSDGAARPARDNMGQYIEALEKLPNASPKMTAVLRDIKNLQRNPLAHPEHSLAQGEAETTLTLAITAISTMVVLLKKHRDGKTATQ